MKTKMLTLAGIGFWRLRKCMIHVVVNKRLDSSGPIDMPSVQSPFMGPLLWKKLAFHLGIADAKRIMLVAEKIIEAA